MKKRWIAGLAFKNLWRYRRRTFITASAIAFGLMMYIWVDSILEGAMDSSERNLRMYETAEAVANPPGYLDDRDASSLELAFPWEDLAAELEAAGAAVTPRIPFVADMVFFKDPFPEDGSILVRAVAVDPATDGDVFRLEDTLMEGRWLSPGEDGAVLGRWMAEDIGAVVGAPVTLATQTRDGYAQTIDLEVVGILDNPNPMVNRDGFYVPLDAADYYLEMGGRTTALYMDLPGLPDSRRRRDAFRGIVEGAGLEYSPWDVQAADYMAMMDAETGSSFVIILLILAIAAVGISNTMLMAVLERSREVGMMRAMGMGDGKIRALFLWESAGIGVAGSVLGLSVGAVANVFMVNGGLDYSSFMRDGNFGYRIDGVFYGTWHPQGFVVAFALGVGISVLVALLSTGRLLKLGIPAVLRIE